MRPVPGPARGPVRGPVETVVAPNPLWASNGVAFGPDGRLWIAQFLGGTLSALDLATGAIETLLGPAGPLVAPDDLAVDRRTGAVYLVDLPPGLVWRRDPDGTMSVVADGIVAPDGIAVHEGRLFVNELYPDGRLLEIGASGHRTMATGLALGNAMEVGPDGFLYYPHLAGGSVWRVGLSPGSEPQRVRDGLPAPVAVRFDAAGRMLVLSNAEPVLFVDGEPVDTGLVGADNLAVGDDGTLYLTSAFRGGVRALAPDRTRRPVVEEGLCGPYGIAVHDGALVVADHYLLLRDGVPEPLFGARGVAVHAGTLHVSTDRGALHAGGAVRVSGLASPAGLASGPDGLLVAERDAGRVVAVDASDGVATVADGLGRPVDVTVDDDGAGYVSDADRGQVIRLADGAVLAAGLGRPEGLAALGGFLYCLDAHAAALVRVDPRRRCTDVVADGLPLAVLPPFARHSTNALAARPEPFAALAVDGDTLLAGTSGDGGIVALRACEQFGSL